MYKYQVLCHLLSIY